MNPDVFRTSEQGMRTVTVMLWVAVIGITVSALFGG